MAIAILPYKGYIINSNAWTENLQMSCAITAADFIRSLCLCQSMVSGMLDIDILINVSPYQEEYCSVECSKCIHVKLLDNAKSLI